MYCLGHASQADNNNNDNNKDRLVNKATITNGLCLWRSQVVRSLRHYLQTQSQGHHTISHLEKRGVKKASAWQFSLKGWEKVIVRLILFQGNSEETSNRQGEAKMNQWKHQTLVQSETVKWTRRKVKYSQYETSISFCSVWLSEFDWLLFNKETKMKSHFCTGPEITIMVDWA